MNTKTPKAQRLVDFIYEIYQKIGERPAGSREEKLAARYIKSVFGQYSEDVILETFKCISRRKQHLINLTCISYLFALFGYLMYPPAAIAIISFTVICYVLIKYFEADIFTILFPVAKSQNIIAKIKPKSETKNLLIFSAHIDSPYVNRIYEGKLREYAFLIKKIFFSLFILLFIICIVKIFNWVPSIVDYLYMFPFAGLGLTMFYQNLIVTYDKSFGANDNLSGISILIGLAQYFSNRKTESTEIWLCAFGAKETGSTGSKYFVRNNFKEIKGKVKVINLDSVAGGALYVITKEYDTNITHDKNMVELVSLAAKNTGISVYEKGIEVINTDASSFSFEKIPATTLLSLDKYGIPLRYHVKEDLPQYISEEQLQDTYKICIEAVRLIDERTKTR